MIEVVEQKDFPYSSFVIFLRQLLQEDYNTQTHKRSFFLCSSNSVSIKMIVFGIMGQESNLEPPQESVSGLTEELERDVECRGKGY